MAEKLKIGIIGNGGISRAHIDAYMHNPNVELWALCDINEDALHRRAEQTGVTRLFTDVNEMVKLPELDAVSVCVWNSAHMECTMAALNAGKHVLCEKPMALNEEQARRMAGCAKKNNRHLQIGFVRRFEPTVYIVKDLIDRGFFGEVYYVKSSFLRRWGCPGGWFGDKAFSGGGPLIDLGVHNIDLSRFLLGNALPVSVYGVTFSKLGEQKNIKGRKSYTTRRFVGKEVFNVEDLAMATVRFDNGGVLQMEASFCLNTEKPSLDFSLYGTKAGAVIDPELKLFSNICDYMANITLEEPAYSKDVDPVDFHNEINHFVECIRTGCECRATAEDGVVLMRILDAIYESARTGHEVVLRQ